MSRRRGSITPPTARRPSWLARVSQGADRPGRSRARLSKTFPTKKEAEAWLTLQLSRSDGGERVPTGRASKLLVEEWLAEWYATWSQDQGEQTREKDQQALRLYLSEGIRQRPLRELSAAELQRHFQGLVSGGLSANTVGRAFRVLRARLNDAVRHGKLLRNPMAGMRAPKVPRRQGRTLTAGEARLFLELCDADRYGALWALLVLTGLRPEEALALRWADFTGEQMHVRRALVRTKGRCTFADTKTGRARVVPLSAYLQRVLRRHRAAQAEVRLQLGDEYRGDALIFASTFGAPLQWSTVSGRYFKPLIARLALRLVGQDDAPPAGGKGRGAERAAYAARMATALQRTGLDRFRPYDTRHTAATLMIEGGESPKTVAEILGHASVTTTLAVYTHVSSDLMGRAAGRLEDAILGTPAAEARRR